MVVRREKVCNGGVVSCLKRGFVSNVMLSTRLNAKQILAEVRNESDSGGPSKLLRVNFVEGVETAVLAAKGRATPTV